MLEFDTGVELNAIQHEVGFLMSVYCFYYTVNADWWVDNASV